MEKFEGDVVCTALAIKYIKEYDPKNKRFKIG